MMEDGFEMFFEIQKKTAKKRKSGGGDVSVESVVVVDEDNDDDIYGDLENSIFTTRNNNNASNKDKEDLENKLMEAAKEINVLKYANEKLMKENKNYAINATSLYKTAKTEIEKKNFIIKQLQSKLQNMTTNYANQRSTLSRREIEEILRNCKEADDEASLQVTVDEITKSINQLTASQVKKPPGYKKQYIFGNMSLYLFREQVVPYSKQRQNGQEHLVESNFSV